MRALFGKEYEMTIEEAVCYLKKQDLAALEVGTYQVNDDFYFMIQEYETKPAENCRLETHNRYADIQRQMRNMMKSVMLHSGRSQKKCVSPF